MSAPLCTVTPLEALRRCVAVLKQVDYADCGESEALWCQHALALSEAEAVLAAPVVPVAAQPVVPTAWRYEWASCITTDGPQDFRLKLEAEPPPAWAIADGQARNVVALCAAPSLEAQPAGEVAQLEQVREAVLLYFDALTARQHGGVAQDKAFSKIQDALGLYWQFGVDHRAMAQGEKA